MRLTANRSAARISLSPKFASCTKFRRRSGLCSDILCPNGLHSLWLAVPSTDSVVTRSEEDHQAEHEWYKTLIRSAETVDLTFFLQIQRLMAG